MESIGGPKGYATGRAFTHSRLYPLVNAFMTQHMATLFDGGVLKIDVADGANDEFLLVSVSK